MFPVVLIRTTKDFLLKSTTWEFDNFEVSASLLQLMRTFVRKTEKELKEITIQTNQNYPNFELLDFVHLLQFDSMLSQVVCWLKELEKL